MGVDTVVCCSGTHLHQFRGLLKNCHFMASPAQGYSCGQAPEARTDDKNIQLDLGLLGGLFLRLRR